eukprot:13279703-Heterocapsa_arctica.AAC.1
MAAQISTIVTRFCLVNRNGCTPALASAPLGSHSITSVLFLKLFALLTYPVSAGRESIAAQAFTLHWWCFTRTWQLTLNAILSRY